MAFLDLFPPLSSSHSVCRDAGFVLGGAGGGCVRVCQFHGVSTGAAVRVPPSVAADHQHLVP